MKRPWRQGTLEFPPPPPPPTNPGPPPSNDRASSDHNYTVTRMAVHRETNTVTRYRLSHSDNTTTHVYVRICDGNAKDYKRATISE